MGRGHESMIRVNDISVSRLHAVLLQTPEGIFLSDNNSKFGTLVLMKEDCVQL
jgi:pSer/pThr/pTyr-binding forkhead associated (FHA) protein